MDEQSTLVIEWKTGNKERNDCIAIIYNMLDLRNCSDEQQMSEYGLSSLVYLKFQENNNKIIYGSESTRTKDALEGQGQGLAGAKNEGLPGVMIIFYTLKGA